MENQRSSTPPTFATTPQKLWKALTTPEFQRIYFGGVHFDTDWKPGSPLEDVLSGR